MSHCRQSRGWYRANCELPILRSEDLNDYEEYGAVTDAYQDYHEMEAGQGESGLHAHALLEDVSDQELDVFTAMTQRL
jgi:hypothetical protein